ncbi:excalibur calcium-binding domain-containing protein [Streptomyces buecherae]|uniref:excalibur calcium-binding domain-containing protein n=1 Tax=Streptomyces buecherae TaxID=2763006 RepID=UPI0027E0A510|nr:excalibur calcium-binding domain-containing protein [Streptomyces buecherae]
MKKIVATVLSLLWLVLVIVTDPDDTSDDEESKAKPTVQETATPAPTRSASGATPTPRESEKAVPRYVGKILREAKTAAGADGFRVVSHDASEGDARQWDADNWRVCFQTEVKRGGAKTTLDFGVVRKGAPCPAADGEPVPWPKMPDVVGQTFAEASASVEKIGITDVTAEGAYTDVTPPAEPDDWTVCFQEPEAREEVRDPGSRTAVLKVVEPGASCPESEGTRSRPDPDVPDPDVPDPDVSSPGDGDADGSNGSAASGGSSSSGSTGGGGVYYANCAAVRAAGADPIRQGQPGYRRGLDRDGDGIACDR